MTTKPTYRDYGIYLRREMRRLVKEYGWNICRKTWRRRPVRCDRHDRDCECDSDRALPHIYTCELCLQEANIAIGQLKERWDKAHPEQNAAIGVVQRFRDQEQEDRAPAVINKRRRFA